MGGKDIIGIMSWCAVISCIINMRTFDREFSEQDLKVCYEEEGELLKQYFWRQTFDVRDGSLSVPSHAPTLVPPPLSLSRAKINNEDVGRRLTDAHELPHYCKCSKFWKPDAALLQCPSPTCVEWLYPECVIGDVLLERWRDICREERRNIGRPKTGPKVDRNSPFIDHSRRRHRLEGRMNEDVSKVVVMDKRGGDEVDGVNGGIEEEVGIRCLICRAMFA